MNSRGNELWLGGNVDRDLLFLSTKGIWIWLGRMGDPQAFVFQQWGRERASRNEMLAQMPNLTVKKKGVYIV
jgi:hypothetical protein